MKPLDGIDGGKPGNEREQPETATQCRPARRDRRFRQASRVGAGEPREAEQQQRRRDGDRYVGAPALRQEYAEHEDCRRQQEHVAQRVGDLCERNRGPAHQSVRGDGQERKAPRSERAADHEHE